MHNTQREQSRLASDSFVIQIRSITGDNQEEALDQNPHPQTQHTNIPSIKFSYSAMKLFHRFRKVLMRLMFSVPSRRSSSSDSRHVHSNDRFEPPKTSCSSYYFSYSHYNEAIADCIEFFNKSAHDGFSAGRKSDV